MFDCKILRQQLFRVEAHCYSYNYFLYVSVILIALAISFCFLTILCLLFAVGKEYQEKQKYEPKPTKIYVETGGDDVVDINDNEKVPMS